MANEIDASTDGAHGHCDHDAALVAAAVHDARAFAPLYERYANRLYRYALAHTRSATVAEDIVGDTLAAVLEQLHTFDPDRGAFAAWVFSIARRRVVDHYRRQHLLSQAHLSRIQVVEDEPDTLETVVERDEALRVRAVVNALPAADRDLVLLRYSADLNSTEIAAMLGITSGAVRMRLQRIRQQLAAILGDDT